MPYRKPQEICQHNPAYEKPYSQFELERFSAFELKRLDESLNSHGLAMRRMELTDISNILEIMAELFDESVRQSERDVYKNVRWGGCGNLVIENALGEIVGFYLCASYAEGASLGAMMGASLKMSGKKLGLTLEQYSFLKTLCIGSKVRYGGVRPDNYKSLKILFNQMGYVGEDYLPHTNPKLSRILLCLQQTPSAFYNNRIDLGKVQDFLNSKVEGQEWIIVSCDDYSAIDKMYSETAFRIAAYLPAEKFVGSDSFLALPKEVMILKEETH